MLRVPGSIPDTNAFGENFCFIVILTREHCVNERSLELLFDRENHAHGNCHIFLVLLDQGPSWKNSSTFAKKRQCIFVGSLCADYRERCRILTAVFKMFKTSEPLYNGELMSWTFFTMQEESCTFCNKRHMTKQQIYFSGLIPFVHTRLGLIWEIWMLIYL